MSMPAQTWVYCNFRNAHPRLCLARAIIATLKMCWEVSQFLIGTCSSFTASAFYLLRKCQISNIQIKNAKSKLIFGLSDPEFSSDFIFKICQISIFASIP
jgi:hypothetical protein